MNHSAAQVDVAAVLSAVAVGTFCMNKTSVPRIISVVSMGVGQAGELVGISPKLCTTVVVPDSIAESPSETGRRASLGFNPDPDPDADPDCDP